jgi:hypothetical protein
MHGFGITCDKYNVVIKQGEYQNGVEHGKITRYYLDGSYM